jgi:hypothetical protein
MNGNNGQNQPVQVTARPVMYIDVDIGNGKQVYPIDVARELHKQLGLALASLNPPANTEKKTPEIPLPSQ